MIRTMRLPVLGALLLAAGVLLTGCAEQAAAPATPQSTTARRPAVARSTPQSSVQSNSARSRTSPPSASPTVRAASAAVNPCAGNHRGRLVRVSLAVQHLWMCNGTHLVRDTPITSGMSGPDTETPRGHYEIQGLNRHSTLTLNSGAQYDVQYWIPFDAPNFGFHDSPWQHFPYGSAKYRTAGSHGCVHMPLPAIKFLYGWADIGTRVVIA